MYKLEEEKVTSTTHLNFIIVQELFNSKLMIIKFNFIMDILKMIIKVNSYLRKYLFQYVYI